MGAGRRLNHERKIMAKEETKKAKKEITEESPVEEVSEKELLKQAEEREKERKEKEEEEKKAEKEAEKEAKAEEKEEKKAVKKQVRIKPRHGKKYRKLAEQIEKDKEYPLQEAIDLALATSPVKFDATVEIHVKMNPKEKNIRGMIGLPGGLAKEKTIKEVTEGNADEVIADIKAGKIDFDLLIADIKIMPKLAPLAKVLGPKGLMPSPKAGTAVADVKKAAEELRSGKVEYRADKTNIVHLPIGKISFGSEKVAQNFNALIGALPVKRIESIYITTSMGPSVKVAKK